VQVVCRPPVAGAEKNVPAGQFTHTGSSLAVYTLPVVVVEQSLSEYLPLAHRGHDRIWKFAVLVQGDMYLPALALAVHWVQALQAEDPVVSA